MANLTINGIDITLSASLSGTDFTLTGTTADGTVTGYAFVENNEPGATGTYGIQYEIIAQAGASLTVTHAGYSGESINVWTVLPEEDGDVGGPVTPRGTEVVVKGD